MQLLDADWLDAASTALADLPAPEGLHAVIDYVVAGAPRGKVTLGVVIEDGRVTGISEGRSDAPDVTVSAGYDAVVSILTGETSADAGYMNGALKVEGAHARWLLELRPVRLAAVEALAPLMRATEL